MLTVDLVNHTVAQSVSCLDLIKQCCMVYHLDVYLLQSIQEESLNDDNNKFLSKILYFTHP